MMINWFMRIALISLVLSFLITVTLVSSEDAATTINAPKAKNKAKAKAKGKGKASTERASNFRKDMLFSELQDYRSVVSLRKGDAMYLHYGGGVILNDRWILTLRRHLVPEKFNVRTLRWEFGKPHRNIAAVPRYADQLRLLHGAKIFRAEQIYCHDFRVGDLYPSFTDIGLIKLAIPIPLGPPPDFSQAKIIEKPLPYYARLIDFGYVEEGPGRKVGKLMRWPFMLKSCRHHERFKPGPLYCAQGRDSIPIYPGEEGNPSFFQSYLVGLASFPQLGNLMDDRNFTLKIQCGYSFFMNVTHFLPWIRDVMKMQPRKHTCDQFSMTSGSMARGY